MLWVTLLVLMLLVYFCSRHHWRDVEKKRWMPPLRWIIAVLALTAFGVGIYGNTHYHQPLMWIQKDRLGNQLFEFSTAYCTAIKTDRTPVVYKETELLSLFPYISAKIFDKMPTTINKSNTVTEKSPNSYLPNIIDQVKKNKESVLDGHFQSWKYFHECEKKIRQQLIFNQTIQTVIKAYMMGITVHFNMDSDTPVTFIGVHVRRGDREDIAAPIAYINKAITYYVNKVKFPIFIVASDDISWCEKHITHSGVNIYFSKRNQEEDFVLLASCNHSIITVGTFGWWAAWLAGGDVVYYGGWRKNKQIISDHFPPRWISMV